MFDASYSINCIALLVFLCGPTISNSGLESYLLPRLSWFSSCHDNATPHHRRIVPYQCLSGCGAPRVRRTHILLSAPNCEADIHYRQNESSRLLLCNRHALETQVLPHVAGSCAAQSKYRVFRLRRLRSPPLRLRRAYERQSLSMSVFPFNAPQDALNPPKSIYGRSFSHWAAGSELQRGVREECTLLLEKHHADEAAQKMEQTKDKVERWRELTAS
ncbi:hypothetical protein B0H19DRAFT_52610 [Mycena capillaripes]|nr:hypothetical protein B0H19DRAFT_52610 [Mycena capillaripes]